VTMDFWQTIQTRRNVRAFTGVGRT
jgi:hypothetical protein